MPTDPKYLADRLRSERVVDSGRMKDSGIDYLRACITRWDGLGWHAYVAVLPRGESVADAHAVWDAFEPGERDLIVLYDGKRWDARGWGLDSARIAGELSAAAPLLEVSYSHGLRDALNRLGAAASGTTYLAEPKARGIPESAWRFGLVGLGGVTVLGALAWVMARRQQRGADRAQRRRQALAACERARSDVMAAASTQDPARASHLRSQIARLDAELSSLGRDDDATLTRIEQISDEISALQAGNRPARAG